ncbi:hypothetical protein AWB81_05058 [Caballeronia arationis]|uniref:hypothetical protein n=1 Tax=Caballeronia arationis TaxID=1777142 RepID=UPI00074CBEE9|nr:hypothetical protein [Caballeronia arationis]SAK92915.1 hypothetical protein AWB81_05058 [Caballeronia arationis]
MKNRIHKKERTPRSEVVTPARWRLVVLLVVLILAIPVAVVLTPFFARHPVLSSTTGQAGLQEQAHSKTAWHVGMLRPDGLRIIPSGRSNASHVLNPNQFAEMTSGIPTGLQRRFLPRSTSSIAGAVVKIAAYTVPIFNASKTRWR